MEVPEFKEPTPEELETVLQSGRYGDVKPSKLFLSIRHYVLDSLKSDSEGNVVAPSTTQYQHIGQVPLTVVSTVPDVFQHYYELIVNAKSDVIIGTNFWRNGQSTKLIGDALIELSRRLEASKRPAIPVRIILDRGSISMTNPRQIISEKDYTGSGIGLPSSKELPYISLEVMNYHNFPLGTFHPKFLIVDGRTACINSCNLQDNSNLEMMCHIEGPIVQMIYDMAVASWSSTSATTTFPSTSAEPSQPDIPTLTREAEAANAKLLPGPGETFMQPITRVLNNTYQPDVVGTDTATDSSRPFIPYAVHSSVLPIPITLVNRKPFSPLGRNAESLNAPQNIAWLSAIQFAQSDIYIQTPDLNAEPVVPAILTAITKRNITITICLCLGYNDFGEMIPGQGGTNDFIVRKLYSSLPSTHKHLLKVWWYTGRDMLQPINALEVIRTCHIKLMIVDGQVGIMGSGNQDTQSWFHSQEVNIMLDSKDICTDWMKQLMGNQNSKEYGVIGQDGEWRGKNGEVLGGRLGGLAKRAARLVGLS